MTLPPAFSTALAALALLTADAGAHGSLHDLIERADKEVATQPDNPSLLLHRAELLRQHGDHPAALADLTRIAGIRPDLPERLLVEAKVRLDLGQPEAAALCADRYLEAVPGSIDGLLLRSRVNERRGDATAAIADVRAAIEASHEASLPLHLHLITLLRKGGDPAQVKTAYRAARTALGPVPSLLRGEAAWLASTGDRSAAATVLAELRAAIPSLSFPTWAEETRLWSGHDPDKARRARREAERAWELLSPAIRNRSAMQKQRTLLDAASD